MKRIVEGDGDYPEMPCFNDAAPYRREEKGGDAGRWRR